ncbi:contractile injection system tape measure protein [Hymenobacter cellulosivorans]|uniref:Contractile injection system tape measure protein n=1 Tax=Hymenobacter cellulosivorans TaxID=2932249 RepID=A0ABY4F6T3_9BACT|nr:contractile injection system tape measure protein [Hymenobacter cellulosivorans]UOQ52085.1 contractile injection system tape measure protein [Hymenobacter cellulosivorans]
MSRQPHAIQQLRFELASDNSQLAPRLQDRVSSLYRHQLEALLGEELSHNCPPDLLLTLPELVLDLGSIADSQLENELPARLRQALYAALGPELQRRATQAHFEPKQAAGALGVLPFFLAHGYLPWQTDASHFSLAEAVLQALNQTPVEFRSLLRRLGQQESVRQRLVRQLRPDHLQRLIGLLEPTHALLIQAYIQETIRAQEAQRLAPVRDADLQQVVYELVLTDLLISRSTQFNRRTFVESQIRRLAARFNLTFEGLLRRLVVLSQKPLPFSAQSSLPGILRSIYQDISTKAPSSPTPPHVAPPPASTAGRPVVAVVTEAAEAAAAPLEMLIYFLRHESLPYWAGARRTATDLRATFSTVLQQGWEALVSVVRQAGPQPAAATLARRFPTDLLQQVVRLAVPGQVRPFLAVLAEHRQVAALHFGAAAAQQQLWEKSFQYLLPHKPTPFNSQHFSRWLARQLSVAGPEPAVLAAGAQATASVGPPTLGPAAGSLQTISPPAGSRKELRDQPLPILLPLNTTEGAAYDALGREVLVAPQRQPLGATGIFPSGPYSAASNQALANSPLAPAASPLAARSDGLAQPASLPAGQRPSPAAPTSYSSSELPDRHLVSELSTAQIANRLVPSALSAPQSLGAAGYADRTTAALAEQRPNQPYVGHSGTSLAATAGHTATTGFFPGHSTGGAGALSQASPAAVASGTIEPFFANVESGRSAAGYAMAADYGTTVAAKELTLNQVPGAGPEQLPLHQWPLPVSRGMVHQYLRAGDAVLVAARLSGHAIRQLLRHLIEQGDAETLAFLRIYPTQALAQQRLSALLDFDLLLRLRDVAPARANRARHLWEPVVQVFGTQNRSGASVVTPRLRRLVQAVYYRFTLTDHRLSAPAQQRETRRMAAAHNLSWAAVLRTMRQLATQHPNLAREPLFNQVFLVAPSRPAPAAPRPTLSHSVFVSPGRKRPAFSSGKSGAGIPASAASAASATFQSSANGFPNPAPAYEAAPGAATVPPLLTIAMQDLVFHFLRHGQLPWWQPTAVTLPELRRHLAQLVRARAAQVQTFLASHAAEPAVRQRLAQLADFATLTQLTTATGPSSGRGTSIRRALLALEQAVPHTSQYTAEQFRLFLKETYLLFHFSLAQSSAIPALRVVRQLAASYGLSWKSMLHLIDELSQQQPVLAAEPFFAWLLGAQEAEEQRRHNRRPIIARARQAAAQPPQTTSGTRPAYSALYDGLEHYLQTGKLPHPTPGGAAGSVASLWTTFLRPANRALLLRIRPYLTLSVVRERVAGSVSQDQFFTLLRRLYPVHFRILAAPLHDWLALAAQGVVRLGSQAAALWELVLTAVETTAAARFHTELLLSRLLAAETTLGKQQAPAARGASVAGIILRQAGRAGLPFRSRLPALLQHLDTTARLADRQKAAAAVAPATVEAPEVPALATAYITNAGLVLLWPFLTMLFDRLGYLENRQFKSIEEAYRAVHLLQFLATGAEDFPEYMLVLNKLLCGVQQTQPVVRELALTDEEKETGHGLLGAVISRWEILKKTSVAGLRETFLARNGRLDWQDDKVLLTVETKAFDMLLDQRPWSIAVIRLPWMQLPLYVTWR